MLNKGLLVSGIKTTGPHTHIIVCGAWALDSYKRYGLWSYPNPGDFTQGSIEPLNLFDDHYIMYLYTGTSNNRRGTYLTVRRIDGSMGNLSGYDVLYLGRYDTRESFASDIISTNGAIWLYRDFFKETDVGKPLPIWLSNTPPPWL